MAELKKKATRESYGEALAELGDKYDNLYVFARYHLLLHLQCSPQAEHLSR